MAKQDPSSSQLDLIKSLLHDGYLEKGANAKVLCEKNIMERKIVVHTGIEYLLYRYDPDKVNLFPYFSDLSKLNKICDYILFVEEGKYLYLLLIELKRGTESATNQLIASECFVNFIISSAKRVGVSLTSNMSIRKVRVSEERAKRRNRGTKPIQLIFDENKIINYDHSDVFRIKEVLSVQH